MKLIELKKHAEGKSGCIGVDGKSDVNGRKATSGEHACVYGVYVRSKEAAETNYMRYDMLLGVYVSRGFPVYASGEMAICFVNLLKSPECHHNYILKFSVPCETIIE